MTATSIRRTLALGALLAIAAPDGAAGHVAPADDVDNRYLKLTPMGDRVRIAYTIYVGNRPAALLRRRLDRDRDGVLVDTEARVYGDEVAALVHAAVAVTVDGRPATIGWSTLDVGLGTPEVQAGAFSVDLIGWLCTGGGDHQLALRDSLALERPGESELRVEELHGVRLGARRLGGTPWDSLEAKWNGAGGPLVAGFELAWTSSADAVTPADGRCHPGGGAKARRWPWIAGGAAAAAIAATLVWRRQRRKS